jgi:hypothetical protein
MIKGAWGELTSLSSIEEREEGELQTPPLSRQRGWLSCTAGYASTCGVHFRFIFLSPLFSSDRTCEITRCSHTNTSPCTPGVEHDTHDTSPKEARRKRDTQDNRRALLKTRNPTRPGENPSGCTAVMGCPRSVRLPPRTS